jgi:hypothetical protein
MKKYLMLMLLLISSFPILGESGSAGNGGDGVFCTWRKPMILDYYASGFVGGAHYGSYSPIFDIYRSTKPLAVRVIEILNETYDMTSGFFEIEVVAKDKIKAISRGVKSSLKTVGDYSTWTLVDDVGIIKDSLHDDFIPKGCKILQVAKAIGSDVKVNRSLFNQLDEKQKEVLALHEAIYFLGRKAYGHKNSFLTRSLIRAILRRGGNSNDREIYDAIVNFVFNKLPEYAQNIDEDIPGSGKRNLWRLNIFDLNGEFILEEGQNLSNCEASIIGAVSNKLDLSFSLDDFTPQTHEYVSLIQYLVKQGFLTTDQMKNLSLESYDRAFIYGAVNNIKIIGLNRKDQLFSTIPFKDGNYQCLYKRSIL